jgi:hypothetical protein
VPGHLRTQHGLAGVCLSGPQLVLGQLVLDAWILVRLVPLVGVLASLIPGGRMRVPGRRGTSRPGSG